MNTLNKIITSTLHLFYPHLCNGCGTDVLDNESLLCTKCIQNLPSTQFANYANNPIEKIFWGRLAIESAFSQFYFEKESLIQHLIHQLKYKNNTDIGEYLGEMMGNSILESSRLNTIDVLVPLPLFADKQRKRGYNQSEIICKGISAITKIPIVSNEVIRQYKTETQTRKHRTERWENVVDGFMVKSTHNLANKHILLVDDVITTGATIEACGSKILHQCNCKLSIATLAHASK